jgi:hypothetical protein
VRTFFGDADRDQSAERLLDLGQPRVLVSMFFTVSVTGQKRAFLERSQQVVF